MIQRKMNIHPKTDMNSVPSLLGMAQGILSDKVSRQFDNEHLKTDVSQMNAVDPYTTEDIIAEAEKLYAFIQKK